MATDNQPTTEAFLAVGAAILRGLKSDEYMTNRDPMLCWRFVAELIRSEPDPEKAAQLVQAVSESLNTALMGGTLEALLA